MYDRTITIGEACTLVNGFAFKPSDWKEEGLPIIRIQNLNDPSAPFNYYDGSIADKYLVHTGDLLFSWSGTPGSSFGAFIWDRGEGVLNQHIFNVYPKEFVNKRYFLYALNGSLQEMIDKAHGGVGLQHITKKELEAIEVYIPDPDRQAKIVEVLDTISDVIGTRKEQLYALDQLIKSRFIEMFGDPALNPYGWDEMNISRILSGKVTNGFFAKRDDYNANGNVAVLGVANVVNRMYSACDNLPRTNATDDDIRKFGLKYGDMLFCRSSLVAEGIGKASIVPLNVPEKTLFECHVIRLPLDQAKCVPEYMQLLTTTDYFRKQILAEAKTSTMTTIGQDGILKASILLPPLSLQRQFLAFITETDKSKYSAEMEVAA